jgi:ATP-binding cassette, subfamily B, bacterial
VLSPLSRVCDLARAARLAALDDDLRDFADGFETRIGVNGTRLSGGQAQRAAAARMFVCTPQLLVFDDLSSALDLDTERLLWDRVFAQGATCLVVSHRPFVLERADQVIRLGDA